MFGTINMKSRQPVQRKVEISRVNDSRVDIMQGSELLAVIRLYPDKLEIHSWRKPLKVGEQIESTEHGSKYHRFKLDKDCGSVKLEIKLPNGDC